MKTQVAEIVKETIKTQEENTTPALAGTTTTGSPNTLAYLIYFVFGVLEVLLVFRLIFKITGANPGSYFVGIIYSLTQLFILPFEGIFRRGFAQGVETTSVLEPSTLVAIIVYAVLAWGIIKLVAILSGQSQANT